MVLVDFTFNYIDQRYVSGVGWVRFFTYDRLYDLTLHLSMVAVALAGARFGVHVARDDRDLRAVPLAHDRPHLLLPDRARVRDVVEMRRDDEYVADADADRAARLVFYGWLHSEVDTLDVGHRESRQDRVPVQVADIRSEHVGHVEAFREHTQRVVLLVDHPAPNDLLQDEHVGRFA